MAQSPPPHPSGSEVPESVEPAVLPPPPSPPPPLSKTDIPRPLLLAGSLLEHPTRVLTTSAPSAPRPQRQARQAGGRDARPGHTIPTWEETARRSSSALACSKPAPPGKGRSANSPQHHHGSGIAAPPRPPPTSAPPQCCWTAGEPRLDFFFFFPMQRPRLRLRDLVATRNRLQITTANLQGCCSLVGDTPKLWSCCSPAVPHFKLSSQAHPPCNPPNPARKSQSQERRPVPHKGSTAQPRPGASCGHLPSGWYPVLSSSPAKGSSTD